MKNFTLILITLLALIGFSSRAEENRSASLVVDYNSGKVLHEENAHALRNPASLVKMMTIYMAFKGVSEGKLDFNQMLVVSKKASLAPRTNINLRAGERISLINAILSLIVHSANDAAIVIGENIAGSEEEFARQMTIVARRLGMNNTNFMNASGLHHPKQKTTAYDLAKLAIALKRDFPNYYHLFTRSKFTYKGITYRSHNNVTKNQPWADGLKTGYTRPSGFNLATSGRKGNIKLIGVVMGGVTAKARDDKMVSLMTRFFNSEQKLPKIIGASGSQQAIAKSKPKPIMKASRHNKKIVKKHVKSKRR